MSNLVSIVNEIISYIEDSIENSGMEGDYQTVDGLSKDLELFESFKVCLQQYYNPNVTVHFLPSFLSVNFPDMKISLFYEYVKCVADRKRRLVEKLKSEVAELDLFNRYLLSVSGEPDPFNRPFKGD